MLIDRSSAARLRAFTLMELFVALACGAIIMTAAIGVVVVMRTAAVGSATRAQLDRDLRVVVDLVGRDLQFFGAGIPSGACIDESCTGVDLLPVMRVARADGMVFFGDQPYPNAEMNGTMNVVYGGRNGAGDLTADDHVVVTSEVSGGCVPWLSGAAAQFQCSSSASTLVPGVYVAADDCNEAQETARTCPWGMGKLQGATGVTSHLVVAQPDGRWFRREWAGTFESIADPYDAIHFVHTITSPGGPNLAFVQRYTFVSQPDRVFYSFEDASGAACGGPPCRLMRRQCWGDMSAPDAAGFPVEGTGAIRSGTTPTSCAPSSAGTGWEEVTADVKSFQLSYFQNPTTPLAAPVAIGSLSNIRLVQLVITLEKTPPGAPLPITRTVTQLYFLPNRERDGP